MRNIVKLFTRLFLCVFLSVFGIWSGQKSASAENDVIGFRLGEIDLNGNQALRLVIETDKPLEAQLFLLDSPWRLVVDGPGLGWNVSSLASSGQLSSGPATAFRFGQPKAGIGRLVIEMNAPASPERVFALPPREVGGHRLVIDLIDKGLTRFKLAQKSLEANGYAVIQSNQAQAINTAAKPAACRSP